MRAKWVLGAVVAAVVVVATAMALPTATRAAAEQAMYCLNGVSTTLPAPVSASSETDGDFTGMFTEQNATDVLAADPSGTFYVGYHPDGSGGGNWLWRPGWWDVEGYYEAGYTTNSIALGACQANATGGAPVPSRVGVCKMLMRGDGTMGMFQEISVAEWNNPDGKYFDAPAANWVEGLGLTCDNPVALGYKAAGYNVAWGGQKAPNHDSNGVRGSGFNNIYPYFTK